ncbi:MAG TPA: PH domain-containing protein [Haliangiales bacterium]|nr:PH domain-containing protein [Haliangiales bacterium]
MHHDDDAHLHDVNADAIFALTRPDRKLLTLYFIYSLAANVAFPFAFLPLYFRFITLRYRFDKEGVSVSYGLLWRRESYLTFARIQDIHVSRNLFERWLGLGTVQIQTASGSASAEESIVGVKEFNEIRNFLYARMRGHKLKAGTESASAGSSTVDELLAGIRDELHAIRELVETKRHV